MTECRRGPEDPWTKETLRAWRLALGWTQEAAATALAFSEDAYKKMERGTRPVEPRTALLARYVDQEHRRRLCSVVGVGRRNDRWDSVEAAADRLADMARDGRLIGPGGQKRFVYLSLFAGLESATAAFERLGEGAVCAGLADVDPAANALCRLKWPDVPRLGDVRDAEWGWLRGKVDLVCGGPPCQSFSRAGPGLGLADPRGDLSLHFVRVVAAIRPRWFLMENVPGMLALNDGIDFGRILHALDECGYSVAWRTLDLRGFGVPQRRRRVFIVGEYTGSASGPCSALALPPGG